MKLWIYILILCCSLGFSESQKRDVVFIIVDDLNDWVGVMGGHPQAITPNIDALAARGVLFDNAHCNAPQCGPSRTSLLHGMYPKSTGRYFNSSKVRPHFFGDQPLSGVTSKVSSENAINLWQHFKNNRYRVVSGGKVAHGSVNPKLVDAHFKRPGELGKDSFTDDKKNLWGDSGPQKVEDDLTGDHKVAKWAISEWNKVTDQPLLMTVGFYRPHRPLNAPQKYFEKFPLDKIQLPKVPKQDDWSDMPEYAKALARSHAHKPYFGGVRSDHEEILHLGGVPEWKYMVQSYLACVNYVDTQIGLFLEALKHNPRGRETVIVLTSDHGWHLGEKKHWCKGAIWRDTTRVPFIVSFPGIAKSGTVNSQPISHVDIYPSLCDFAEIPKPSHLQGESISELLKNPDAKREAAILAYGPENLAYQTETMRYILYEDGSEELYDHVNDPNEWHNLASSEKYQQKKRSFKAQLEKFKSE